MPFEPGRYARHGAIAGIAAGLIQIMLTGAAPAASPVKIPTPFDKDGYSLLISVAPDDCLVVSSIDFSTMLKQTTDLQAKGLIRDDVSPVYVKSRAWTTAAAIALKIEPIFVVTAFRKNPSLESCKFGQAFIDFDGKVTMAYGFTMTRAIYDKQNWEAFTGTDLPNVAEHFVVDPVAAAHMNAEAKLPD